MLSVNHMKRPSAAEILKLPRIKACLRDAELSQRLADLQARETAVQAREAAVLAREAAVARREADLGIVPPAPSPTLHLQQTPAQRPPSRSSRPQQPPQPAWPPPPSAESFAGGPGRGGLKPATPAPISGTGSEPVAADGPGSGVPVGGWPVGGSDSREALSPPGRAALRDSRAIAGNGVPTPATTPAAQQKRPASYTS
ncbi:hypothetical protein HK405_001427, partial [Cladochytrium tenue]